MRIRFAWVAMVVASLGIAGSSAPVHGFPAGRFPSGEHAARGDDWYRSDQGRQVVENVISHQSPHGSWPKNFDTSREPYRGNPADLHGTFDNGASRGELRFLAKAYRVTGDRRALDAFHKGLDKILEAQYANGGWPQTYPPGKGYDRHITFNDGAMIGLMTLMRDVAQSDARSDDFEFVDGPRRQQAARAFDQGVECILKCQIVVDGRSTAWCAQHDEITLKPRKARSYEHPSISGGESAGIIFLLMSLEHPKPEVIRAVDAACRWYEQVQLRGIRLVRKDDDRVIVADADAPPLWARFYEIGTNRPIFSGRDGVIKYSLAEIEHERRTGYSWYGESGREILKQWPSWRRKHRLEETP